MQVFNQTKATAVTTPELPLSMREGQTFQATVKETLPKNEAIVQIKGQELRVKVEGTLPESGKVSLQAMNVKDNIPVMKVVSQANTATASPSVSFSEPVKQALQILQQHQLPVTKEMVQNIQTYMEKTSGTTEQKLETITRMAAKQLDFTPSQIRAVHETLHGPALGKVLQEVVTELESERSPGQAARNPLPAQLGEALKNLENRVLPTTPTTVERQAQLSQMVRELVNEIIQNPTKSAAAQEKLLALIKDSEQNAVDAKILQSLLKNTSLGKMLTTSLQQGGVSNQHLKDQFLQALKNTQLLGSEKVLGRQADLMQLLRELTQNPTNIATQEKLTALLKENVIDGKLLQTLLKNNSLVNMLQQDGATSENVKDQLIQTMRTAAQQNQNIATINESPSNQKDQLLSMLQQIQKELANTPKSAVAERMIQAVQAGRNPEQILTLARAEFAQVINEHPPIAKAAEAVAQQEQSSIIDDLHSVLTKVKKAPDLANVIQTAKELPPLSASEQEILNAAVAKAESLLTAGRELAARQELAKTLEPLVQTHTPAKTTEAPMDEAEFSYRMSNELLAAIPVQSRDLLVTTITKKLSQAAIDFKHVKRELAQNLQIAETVMKQSPVQARTSLEAAIKQLDNAILKSDFMLYTDMGTEKKLLQASSQLHEARKLLGKGERARAAEIVQQVKTTVDKLVFQPSDQRVTHMVSSELSKIEELPLARQVMSTFEEPLQAMRQEPTPRHAMEYIRSLGLGHDTDAAHRLATGDMSRQDESNLKQMLMKVIQAEGQNAGQRAEQALQNITGQQLLAKPDPSSLQTMFLALPIILRDQVENVKVFLRSNQQDEKIDWENCSLYFLLETQRMGEVGIHLTAVDKTISVTLKNDQPEFQQRITPLVAKTKERLSEIGYNVGTIQFTKLSASMVNTEPKQNEVKTHRPTFSDHGYDFSV